MRRHLTPVGTGVSLGSMIVPNEFLAGLEVVDFKKGALNPGEISTLTVEIMQKASGGDMSKDGKGELKGDGIGIKSRRWLRPVGKKEELKDLAIKAAIKAVESTGMDPKEYLSELKVIMSAHESRIPKYPTLAQRVQEGLTEHYGIKLNIDYAQNTSFACAGFPITLLTANALVRAGEVNGNVLVVGAEDVKGLVRKTKEGRYDVSIYLFGVGAAAMASKTTTEEHGAQTPGYVKSMPYMSEVERKARMSNSAALYDDVDTHITMADGALVKSGAIDYMRRSIIDQIKKHNPKGERRVVVCPHQANGRINGPLERDLRREGILRITDLYYASGLEDNGNISVPACLTGFDSMVRGQDYQRRAVREGQILPNDLVIITAVGAGMSGSAASIIMPPKALAYMPEMVRRQYS
ncbi:MAG: hypothetical protein AABW73_01680 [Nanoarchaeota archaeon]